MRAVVVNAFGEPDTCRVQDLPDPVAGDGEVLVRVHACAANYVDLLVFRGLYQFLPDLPFVPGKGPAGEVVATGTGVHRVAPGDRVLAMAEKGGYGELVTVDQAQVHRIPPTLTYPDAASMSLVFDTAWVALHARARLQAGESVLVLGATGGVGHAAVQLARAAGARVLAATASPAKRPLIEALRPDGIVDLSTPDLKESLREQVFALNDGRGVDVVIDPLGGDALDAALRAVAWEGRLVIIGFAAGRIADIRSNYLLLKNIEVSGLQVSDYRVRRPELIQRCFAEVFDGYREGALSPAPVVEFPLEAFARALKDVETRRIAGRAILLPP